MSSNTRILFAKVQIPTQSLEFLIKNFAISSEKAVELIELGAVYVNQTRLTISQNLDSYFFKTNDIIRLHKEPKRFPIHRADFIETIQDTQNWICVLKPHGLPSHPTLDNKIENCLSYLELKLKQKLWSLNRLDVGTGGLLFFAKNAKAAREWNMDILPQTKKYYSALVTQKMSSQVSQNTNSKTSATNTKIDNPTLAVCKKLCGRHRHWMLKSKRSPKVISNQERVQDQICELEVLSVDEFCPENLKDSFHSQNSDEKVYIIHILLFTGRTHQIRAQLSYLGFPILGDSLYGGLDLNQPYEEFALKCDKVILPDLTELKIPAHTLFNTCIN